MLNFENIGEKFAKIVHSNEWKEVQKKFNLGKSTTTYYESGTFEEETSWDLIVPNKLITKVKKYIKDNS